MSLRTIMIFPTFENIAVIDQIREKYDPLAKLVRPHITIVFPFEDDMGNEALAGILNERLADIKPFPIELHGWSKCEDRFGNYLFLNVVKGRDKMIEIHNLLYAHEFSKFDIGLEFSPHMTVGKVKDKEELERAYAKLKDRKDSFVADIDKISVEMIGENEESIIIFEKKLDC